MADRDVDPQSSPPRRMTVEEWAALPEDDLRELVDGLLEEPEVTDFLHEVVDGWLVRILGNWLAGRGGFVATSGAKYRLAADRGRMPDVSVFLPGRRPPARGVVPVPPDLAVEVVSPRPRDVRRDRVEKVEDYAAFGVRWYWIVDPGARTFEVLGLDERGRYVHLASASAGVLEEVPGCEGLTLDLDALWAEVERLEPDS